MGNDTVIRPPAIGRSAGGEACLVFVEGQGTVLGQRIALRSEVVLGRDPTCSVRLEADDVSRRHARVVPDGNGHLVGDLGSLNGTWVNGLEIEVRRLTSGDRIRVGPYVAKYLSAGDAEVGFHDELLRRATTDSLTGLPNRATFEDCLRLEMEAARRERRPLALVLVDIDHFKRINDERGHPVGDEVLREVARRLQTAVRAGDLVARVGGEEFAALLPGTDLAAASEVGERMGAQLRAAPVRIPDGSVVVTASCGVTTFDPHDDELSFVSRADVRLYEAKRDGRNCVRT